MKKLFETPEEIEASIAILRGGKDTAFWRLFCDILDGNIDHLEMQIITKPEGFTEKDLDRLRDRLLIYKEIRHTPEVMVRNLTGKVGEELNLDPYDEQEKEDKA